MTNFKIGDHVWAGEHCYVYGTVVELTEDYVYIEYETRKGGGCVPFKYEDVVLAG